MKSEIRQRAGFRLVLAAAVFAACSGNEPEPGGGGESGAGEPSPSGATGGIAGADDGQSPGGIGAEAGDRAVEGGAAGAFHGGGGDGGGTDTPGGGATGSPADGGGPLGDGGNGGDAADCQVLPEICDNGSDENCDGHVDEGCSCAVVAKAQGGSFLLPGSVIKLQADPVRCLTYAVTTTTPSELLVIDTGAKSLLQRVPLPGHAVDFDLATNGQYLVVVSDSGVGWRIDPISRRLDRAINLLGEPRAVEVASDGTAYYSSAATNSQAGGLYYLDIGSGETSPVSTGVTEFYAETIELSRDEQQLFAAGASISRWKRSGENWSLDEFNTWSDYTGGTPLYLPPSGVDLYAGVQRFSANPFTRVIGRYAEVILAQDAAATFEVGRRHVFDARTSRPLASLPHEASAATLVNADRELWYESPAAGRLYYANVGDFVDGVELGVRERAARALGYYTITRILADPKRDRLYGLDPAHQSVLTIDATTLLPITEIAVPLGPSDFTLDDSGNHLLVGHDRASVITRIDLDSVTFDELLDIPMLSSEIAALSNDRLVISGADGPFHTPIIDSNTGEVLEYLADLRWGGALTTALDRTALFVSSNTHPRHIAHFDTSTMPATLLNHEEFVEEAESWAVALPDGSGLFVSYGLLDGNDFSMKRYDVPARIFNVTPDSALATTFDSVLRVSDGALLGKLSSSGTVQCLSPHAEVLYVLRGNSVEKVSLGGF